ncbi:DUF58 domain-containing protein [Lentibacillus sp. CBA3610]|uniref:DUF58 domain-containing protein n=1 Tax=Lentibacillus sp. CBA3610 TaxID=2518176 RepID=UPI0015960167|nr:DUF58 domain-containing protein [Lentibacillus sp. CBA3610]QKY69268.1 DUF58 domain-containing protein [Lentibacillus sp. CBA3610]
MKSLKNLWERLLFRDRGILPGKRLLVLFLIFSFGAVVLAALSSVSWTWLPVMNGLLFLISLLDLWLSPKRKELSFKRELPDELERDMTYSIQIEVVNASDKSCDLRLIDGLPQSFRAPFPLTGTVKARGNSVLSYQVQAPVRGQYEVDKLFIRYKSNFGLWTKQLTVQMEHHVKVIPDLTETKQYLNSPQQFLLYEGSKIRKQRAETGEFAQIRNYVVGDDPRKINWRQTAKLQEIMTNEYEPEHGKYVTILIDCSRMMGAELKKGNRLEKALEAALTTAAAALKNGDYVAVLAFSKEIQRFVPPAKGMNHLQQILQAIYNVKVEATEANYSAAINYLSTVLKKRSLILLFSDVHSFLHEESALHHLRRLRQRHLFMMIGIEDEELLARTKQALDNTKTAMVKSIAQQQLHFKKREKANWEKQGLSMIEANEEHLATAAVSQYIRIMNEGLL